MGQALAATIPTMVGYQERLNAAMKEASFTTAKLAEGLGLTYQAVDKVVKGKTKSLSAQNNDRAAKLLGVNPSWLANGEGPRLHLLTTKEPAEVAQALSQRAPIVEPDLVVWEQLPTMELEGMFRMEVRGDALTPRYLPGQFAIWQAGDTARNGQPVLIGLPGDRFELRYYEGRGDTWAGVSQAIGHRELLPDRDGAKVLARLRYLDLD